MLPFVSRLLDAATVLRLLGIQLMTKWN
jgi:hypothetical protein